MKNAKRQQSKKTQTSAFHDTTKTTFTSSMEDVKWMKYIEETYGEPKIRAIRFAKFIRGMFIEASRRNEYSDEEFKSYIGQMYPKCRIVPGLHAVKVEVVA